MWFGHIERLKERQSPTVGEVTHHAHCTYQFLSASKCYGRRNRMSKHNDAGRTVDQRQYRRTLCIPYKECKKLCHKSASGKIIKKTNMEHWTMIQWVHGRNKEERIKWRMSLCFCEACKKIICILLHYCNIVNSMSQWMA